MKPFETAKQHWQGLKDSQRSYVFNAIWMGEIIPGLPFKVTQQIKKVLSKVKEPPGITYKKTIDTVNEIIEEYKQFKFDTIKYQERKELIEKVYPTKVKIGLRLSAKEIQNNQTIKNMLDLTLLEASNERFTKVGLIFLEQQLLTDLKESEERDKTKVLATI